jgi:hypothetical protein
MLRHNMDISYVPCWFQPAAIFLLLVAGFACLALPLMHKLKLAWNRCDLLQIHIVGKHERVIRAEKKHHNTGT